MIITLVFGFLSSIFGFVLGCAISNRNLKKVQEEYILLYKGGLPCNVVKDWEDGLCVVSPRFTYKTFDKVKHLKIVKQEVEK